MYPQPTHRTCRSLASLLICCSVAVSGSRAFAGEQESLADLANYPGFETLRAALDTTSLPGLLAQRRDATLLAPSNEAFASLADRLGCGSPQELLEELDVLGLLEGLLRDHLAAGSYSAQDLLRRGEVELDSGLRAIARVGAGGVTVSGTFNPLLQSAPAITAELTAKNGSALAINGVVLNIDPAGVCGFDPNAAADQIVFVEGDRQLTIGGEDSTSVGLDRTQSIGGNEILSIRLDRDQSVNGSETLTIGTHRAQNIGGHDNLSVGADRSQSIGGDDVLSTGANRVRTVGGDETLSIGGDRDQSVGGNEALAVGGSQTLFVGKDQVETITQARSQAIGTNDALDVGKSLVIEAGDSITIKTGSASITMKQDGTIIIDGKDISLRGSGEVNIKAGGDLVLKGQKILQN